MNADSREKWEALSQMWMSVKAPVAPSDQDVGHYLKAIPQGARAVGILGCTPVLRTHIRERVKHTISLDISSGMLTRSVMQLPLSHSERLVQCDWRQLPLASNSLDALLGDKVFDNVLPHDWERWVDEMSRVLAPEGALITRISARGRLSLSVPSTMELEEAVSKWAAMSDPGPWSAENACAGLWEEVLAASTRAESEHTGTQQTSRLLPGDPNQVLNRWPIRSREGRLAALFVERYWTSRFFTWSAYTMEGVVRALDHAFALCDALVADDYPEARRQPVLAFVSRCED